MRFDSYTVTLLRLRPDAPELSDDEATRLQDRHLAHGARLRAEGVIVAMGPVRDQGEDSLRGITVWSVDRETARAHALSDPAVVAGRLAVEVITWMTPAGNVTFHQVRAPSSVAEALADD
jgi:uncharacterized protein YciI